MDVESIAGELGEGRTRPALSPHSVCGLADHWTVSDFVVLTKPRVMMLALFTALVGLSSAPSRLDRLGHDRMDIGVVPNVEHACGTHPRGDSKDRGQW